VLKVQDERDQIIVAKLYEAAQEHVFDFWEELTREQRRSLLDQLDHLDLQLLARLDRLRHDTRKLARPAVLPVLEPPPVVELPRTPAEKKARSAAEAEGRAALEQGKVACFLAAGGQGTRLGWEHPKGTYPVGPVSGKSLFQLFAEQIIALNRKTKKDLLWFIMTSSSNREETETFWKTHSYFGLPSPSIRFLQQRDLPAVDLRGKLLLESKHSLMLSPDGHGGALRALRESGGLEEMEKRGIEQLFYFQVDNPLCRIADPVFLGFHRLQNAEMSTKWVRKTDPDEKVGLLAEKDGKLGVVEYSEIDDQNRMAREKDGALRFRCGNTAIHVFSRAFLDRVASPQFQLHFHLARKAVAHVDRKGETKKPEQPNAIKYETFIFDVLPEASHHVALEIAREEEFEPLKNAKGPYSPETVKRAQSVLHARWLEEAGVKVERDAKGEPVGLYEVSPLTALSAEELKKKLLGGTLPAPRDGKLLV
jgi:UDP-N-acetylglucosamine/UDP-N-acetylgalactosamine diphosphorylase